MISIAIDEIASAWRQAFISKNPSEYHRNTADALAGIPTKSTKNNDFVGRDVRQHVRVTIQRSEYQMGSKE
jgi:hypothetical protein